MDIEADSDDEGETLNDQSEEAELTRIQQERLFNENIDRNVSFLPINQSFFIRLNQY